MKRMLAIMVAGGMMLAGLAPATARAERGVDGLFLGAGGGAILGQAIGRNTEATLIGTAVGGMLGYIIGNEADKQAVRTVRSTVVVEPRRERYGAEVYRYEERARHYCPPKPECRETEILAMVDGRPEVVVTTACLEDGEWVIAGDQRPVRQVVVIKEGHRHKDRYWRAAGPPGRNWRMYR